MQNLTTIQIEDKDVIIKKLPLGRYPELLKGISELPKVLNNFDKIDPNSLLQQLPLIIANCFPDILHILSIATNLPKEEIEALGLDDAVKLVIAVLEINNYKEIYLLIKKTLTVSTLQKTIPIAKPV